MGAFTISETLNPNRVFLLKKSELEKRFDPFYYVPEIVELEKKVLEKNPKKLRDYVLRISSGATPKTTENEKYYTDKRNGIPFLRVQNLSPTGVLEFEDCKYINEETHSGMLKRSQVYEGDLLVKITGVGRMAVSSVAPDGFEGNINQHICVIKTGNKKLSETIAAYLNSDIGERLASRRSTGGTRPALDYPALLSLPIIEDERILEITKKVVSDKTKNESEAKMLFASIDDYLNEELGITLPKRNNLLVNRIFKSRIGSLSGNRMDCYFYFTEDVEIHLNNGTYETEKFSRLTNSIINGFDFREYVHEGTPYIKVANIRKGEFDFSRIQFIERDSTFIKKSIQLRKDNLLLTRKGTYGYALCLDKDYNYVISSEIFYIEIKHNMVNAKYLEIFLNSQIGQLQFDRVKIGAIMGSLSQEAVKSLRIPLPPLEKQNEIVDNVAKMRFQIKNLNEKTKAALKKAN